jgi:hypothetical protein
LAGDWAKHSREDNPSGKVSQRVTARDIVAVAGGENGIRAYLKATNSKASVGNALDRLSPIGKAMANHQSRDWDEFWNAANDDPRSLLNWAQEQFRERSKTVLEHFLARADLLLTPRSIVTKEGKGRSKRLLRRL